MMRDDAAAAICPRQPAGESPAEVKQPNVGRGAGAYLVNIFKEGIDLQPIVLPKPEKDGGKSVLASLQRRKTDRGIRPKPLPLQTLSNLLWAAFGVNRTEGGLRGKPGRTAPSASNSQEIDLYVVLPEGVYLYEAGPHRLAPVADGDFRQRSWWGSATTAPVNIFYVVDLARYTKKGQPDPHIDDPEVQKSYYYVGTGLIAANIHLFAASQGLAAWFHNCDRVHTPTEFKLRPRQRVLFAQTVGYPLSRRRLGTHKEVQHETRRLAVRR